jgi:hypothetical protein
MHVAKLKECLDANQTGSPACAEVPDNEITHVKSWRNFTKAYTAGKVTMPVTTILVVLHNMVSETIDKQFIPDGRVNIYCPAAVFKGLKSGLFIGDKQVQQYQLPSYEPVPGIPGLAERHGSINCPA